MAKTMVVFKTSRYYTTIALFPCQRMYCNGFSRHYVVKSYWPGLDKFSDALAAISGFRKATNDEAAPVKAKLEAKGYDLKVWRRMPIQAERRRWMAKGND